MLVMPDKKKIVISSDKNDSIAEFIPHAKRFVHEGKDLIAVNYGVEESIVLKNMGFSVPEPITQYYKWPARFSPMEHQVATASFLTMNKKAICLNAPGTGKSISSLWAADFLIEQGVAKRVLIIAPLSTLKVVWGNELRHHMPHRSFVICVGDRKKRISLLSKPGVEYVIINHDGFTNMASEMNDFDVVIYDEATALKTPGSQRYKVFFKWMQQHNPWLWLLTGTPISQAPVDAWTLARLIGSSTVSRSYTNFKDTVMKKVSQFKWVPRENALETCRKALQPSIRFSLDECKDLPDTNFVNRETELTPAQAKAYQDMQGKACAVFQGDMVTAANAAVLLGKLLQICCGVIYGEAGTFEIEATNRYNTLIELLEEIGGKVIIFVPLKGVQLYLKEKLVADKYTVELVNGDVSKKDRDEIFHNFQHTDQPQILLAHPKVAAHGLTLTRAKDIIWYAPIYSLEQYEQANARIRRLNTEGKTSVWHIYATKFEAELYRRLRLKQNTLTEFLDLVRGINDDD
jgi:SNF2 family DNA or RNA helicase